MGDAAAQAVGVLPVAHLVDEGSQLTQVVHLSSHHHLFMDDVGLRQICSLLQGTHTHTHNSKMTGESEASSILKSPEGGDETIIQEQKNVSFHYFPK